MDSPTSIKEYEWVKLFSFDLALEGNTIHSQLQPQLQSFQMCTDKPFQCTECKMSFKKEWLLSRHLLTHAEKRFSCHLCKKSYSRFDKLQKHRSKCGLLVDETHSCWFCKKTFRKKTNLLKHRKICKNKMTRLSLEMKQETESYNAKLHFGRLVNHFLCENNEFKEEALSRE